MFSSAETIVKARIAEIHQNDENQLEAIFSSTARILVEAPAGCGKTNTMISKIAYLIATKQIPKPKKLLALTFSVNAAYKIKKEVNTKLPSLLKDVSNSAESIKNIQVTNYHGFCRSVLKKYGNIIHSAFASIDLIRVVDDFDIQNLQETTGISYSDAQLLSNYNTAVRQDNLIYLKGNTQQYCDTIINKLLCNNFITHNGILLLTSRLFGLFPEIKKFYQSYFSWIFIDEFQDTNRLSYWLIRYIITDKTKIVILGDSLQRIYGFIGAIPNILKLAEEQLNLQRIVLNINYRFASNARMLLLDSNIRLNAENPSDPFITKDAEIILATTHNQEEEANHLIKLVLSLLKNNDARIAILFKQRGANTTHILNAFQKNGIDYFYGLFSDDDKFYLKFNKQCITEFSKILKTTTRITKKLSENHINSIADFFYKSEDPAKGALINLLQTFWLRLFSEYSFLSNDDKVSLIKDTFEHNGLKQYIEFLTTRLVFSTVHGAKGLEWDYVLLPDVEQNSFPNWHSLCGPCKYKSTCKLVIDESNESAFLDELSVFYVAVTRAKKQVYFSASNFSAPDKNKQARPRKLSCFLGLKGIVIKPFNNYQS